MAHKIWSFLVARECFSLGFMMACVDSIMYFRFLPFIMTNASNFRNWLITGQIRLIQMDGRMFCFTFTRILDFIYLTISMACPTWMFQSGGLLSVVETSLDAPSPRMSATTMIFSTTIIILLERLRRENSVFHEKRNSMYVLLLKQHRRKTKGWTPFPGCKYAGGVFTF